MAGCWSLWGNIPECLRSQYPPIILCSNNVYSTAAAWLILQTITARNSTTRRALWQIIEDRLSQYEDTQTQGRSQKWHAQGGCTSETCKHARTLPDRQTNGSIPSSINKEKIKPFALTAGSWLHNLFWKKLNIPQTGPTPCTVNRISITDSPETSEGRRAAWKLPFTLVNTDQSHHKEPCRAQWMGNVAYFCLSK